MKTQSAKAKGRRLQQHLRDRIVEVLGVSPEDIESRSMGAGGEDLILAAAAREKFPFSPECKNTERLNLWKAWEQACCNGDKYKPLVVCKRNRSEVLAVLRLDDLLEMLTDQPGRDELLQRWAEWGRMHFQDHATGLIADTESLMGRTPKLNHE